MEQGKYAITRLLLYISVKTAITGSNITPITYLIILLFPTIDQNVENVQEIHYLQEPFVENITSEGIPAVIHYIQLDPSGHELVAESNDAFHRIL